MDIILNQVALWRPCGAIRLNKRLMPANITYRTPSSGVYLRSDKPIIRYCKDYNVGKVKNKVCFCLFVRTDIDNDPIVEKQLDEIAVKLTNEEILRVTANSTLNNFEYLHYLLSKEIK